MCIFISLGELRHLLEIYSIERCALINQTCGTNQAQVCWSDTALIEVNESFALYFSGELSYANAGHF